jgi:cell division protease FtsH
MPIIIIIGVGFYNEKMSAVVLAVGTNFSTSVNQSKTFDEKTDVKTTFKDVAGLEGAKKKYKKL